MAVKTVTLEQLVAHLCGKLEGSSQMQLSGIAELHLANPGELSFLIDEKHLELAKNTKASAVLINESLPAVGLPMIRVKNVPEAINTALELFAQPRQAIQGIHPTALISPQASLVQNVAIGPYVVIEDGAHIGQGTVLAAGCYIGRDCLIGDNCYFFQKVIIADRCRIGHRVILGENVVIGSEGFGYRCRDGRHRQVPHLGAVRIEDDVEIGACSCVARAKFGFTVIGRGTKIDNLVSIAHNVQIGQDCLIAAQSGIAGSARLGNCVVFGGQVGVRDNVCVGDGVIAGARTAIHHDLPGGVVVLGMPALDRRQALREQAVLRRLPELPGRMKKIEQRLTQLESATDHSKRS